MITVNLIGPYASGKTRTIQKAKKALEAQGLKCLAVDDGRASDAAIQRSQVIFKSSIQGQALGFSVMGTGKIGIVTAAVRQAVADVRAENAARKRH